MAKQLKRFIDAVSQTIEELTHIKQESGDQHYARRLADGAIIELAAMQEIFDRVVASKPAEDENVESSLTKVSQAMQEQRPKVAEVQHTNLLGIRMAFIEKHLEQQSIPPLEMVYISSVVVVKLMELYLAAFLCFQDHRKALRVLDDGFEGPALPEQDAKLLFLFLHRIVSEIIGDGLKQPAIPST